MRNYSVSQNFFYYFFKRENAGKFKVTGCDRKTHQDCLFADRQVLVVRQTWEDEIYAIRYDILS